MRLADLLVPALCAVCGAAARTGEPLCAACAARLTRTLPLVASVPGVDYCSALGPHDGIVGEIVRAFKFKRRLPLARVAAKAMAPALRSRPGPLIPVPPSAFRHRWRGFDPAALIAAELGRTTGTPVLALLHRHDRRRQVGRPRSERLATPPRITTLAPPPPKAILVDDVITTGATLNACAVALREAGCTEILALAVARA